MWEKNVTRGHPDGFPIKCEAEHGNNEYQDLIVVDVRRWDSREKGLSKNAVRALLNQQTDEQHAAQRQHEKRTSVGQKAARDSGYITEQLGHQFLRREIHAASDSLGKVTLVA